METKYAKSVRVVHLMLERTPTNDTVTLCNRMMKGFQRNEGLDTVQRAINVGFKSDKLYAGSYLTAAYCPKCVDEIQQAWDHALGAGTAQDVSPEILVDATDHPE